MKMDADGSNGTTAYSYSVDQTVNHDGLYPPMRSPHDTWLPFTIGFAASSNYNDTGYIDYVFLLTVVRLSTEK